MSNLKKEKRGRPHKPDDQKLVRKMISLSQEDANELHALSEESNMPMTFILRKSVEEGLPKVASVLRKKGLSVNQ